MRHLGSLLLSLVLGVVAWVLLGYGLTELQRSLVDFGGLDVDALTGVAALVGAAVFLGVLLLSRLSPVGPLVVGLIYVVLSIWALADLSGLPGFMTDEYLDRPGLLITPATGVGLFAGGLLLLTLFSPRRWRRYDHVPATAYGTPGAAALPYGQSTPAGAPYGQPAPAGAAYGQPAPYGPSTSGATPYGQPTSGAAAYGQSTSGAAAYGQPAAPYGQPATPSYGSYGNQTPSYGNQAPAYGAPPTSAPPVSSAPPVTSTPPSSFAPPGGSFGGGYEEATTRLPHSPTGAPPSVPPRTGNEPTEPMDDGGVTKPLRGTPPPAAAYPPPGHAQPTAPPSDPDQTRQM